ncbi:hypothetical protein DFH09DRAFT_1270255 [Mycena vulgaris]|nr:hypothetical protein DFH09DRAFT_1270255 [Mycena vulgaris]
MPLQPNISQIRFNNIVTALTVALATFKAVTESLKTPFLEPILNALQSLLTVVQTIKRNKDTCTQVLKQIHELIYAIIHLHVHSDTGGQLSPYMLKTLGRFMETLPKIHTFVEAQQQKSRVRKFFRQGEMNSLLKGCQVGLEQALEVFKEYAEKTHQQVLELIACMSLFSISG